LSKKCFTNDKNTIIENPIKLYEPRKRSEPVKIAKLECLHADAGRRNFDFLKITTDDGLVGWSEYNESFGGRGVTAVIENLSP
jgi:hypothetical protein